MDEYIITKISISNLNMEKQFSRNQSTLFLREWKSFSFCKLPKVLQLFALFLDSVVIFVHIFFHYAYLSYGVCIALTLTNNE